VSPTTRASRLRSQRDKAPYHPHLQQAGGSLRGGFRGQERRTTVSSSVGVRPGVSDLVLAGLALEILLRGRPAANP
jgi:hypothetical protein